MPERTPFDRALALFQGRMVPLQATAPDGTFVWTHGFDGVSQELLAFGDFAQIEQDIDVTDVTFLTAQVFFKQPKNLPTERDLNAHVSLDFEILPLESSVITDVVPGAIGQPIEVTTQEDHFLVAGQEIVVAGVLGVLNANGPATVDPNVTDPKKFTIRDSEGSGTYTSGGNIGLGERIYVPSGLTQNDVGSLARIANSVAANNGDMRILGLLEQPSVTPITQAWVERPTPATPLERDGGGSVQATLIGARWQLSLLVDGGAGLKERARIVRAANQTPFFHMDLKSYVRQLAGVRKFALQIKLIEDEPTNFYPLPVQP